MEKPIDNYWQKRLEDLQAVLEGNGFDVFIADDAAGAGAVVQQEILPQINAKSVSWGGSLSFVATGLYDFFKNSPDHEVLDTYDKSIPREELIERRRQALLTDLFLTGTNAVTEAGQLVNLDMIGNRVGAITYGPKHVVIILGRNKIVADLDQAMFRIKDYVAPVNAMRLDMKTPCVKTAECTDCNSPARICNIWTITEKSFPEKRIKVVLVNEDLGF